MPVYQTEQLIDKLYIQTENFKNMAAGEWLHQSPQDLLLQPGENKWSAAQCLEHLNSYGRYYLPAIEKAINEARRKGYEAKDTFKAGFLGNYFTQMMLPKNGGVKKMQAPKGHRPLADLDADKVLKEFIDQQERILRLLQQARRVNLEKGRVPISIAQFIKLKLGDVFMFLIAHNFRHVLQAERALGKQPAMVFASPALA